MCAYSNTKPNSNVGGTSNRGSGPQPNPRTGVYNGGARAPYRSGGISPAGLIAFPLAAAAIIAFWPGWWLHSHVNAYQYHNNYQFRNQSQTTSQTTANSATNNGTLQSLPVICACADDVSCACDETGNNTYIDELVGNGSYAALNKSLITVADYKGTKTLFINGTLPNGTTAADPNAPDDNGTAPGNSAASSTAMLGFWPVAAIVFAMVYSV